MEVMLCRSYISFEAATPPVVRSVVDLLEEGKPFVVRTDKLRKYGESHTYTVHDRRTRFLVDVIISNGSGPSSVGDGYTFIENPTERCHYELREGTKTFRKWNGELSYRHTDKIMGHPTYLLEHPVSKLIEELEGAGYVFEKVERRGSLVRPKIFSS